MRLANPAAVGWLLLVACCPTYTPGPTQPTTPHQTPQDAPGLAVRLANAQGPREAEKACGAIWEPEGDGWHQCVCGLETWRCQAQGWCGQPGETGEPRMEGTRPVEAPEVTTAHHTEGCE